MFAGDAYGYYFKIFYIVGKKRNRGFKNGWRDQKTWCRCWSHIFKLCCYSCGETFEFQWWRSFMPYKPFCAQLVQILICPGGSRCGTVATHSPLPFSVKQWNTHFFYFFSAGVVKEHVFGRNHDTPRFYVWDLCVSLSGSDGFKHAWVFLSGCNVGQQLEYRLI